MNSRKRRKCRDSRYLRRIVDESRATAIQRLERRIVLDSMATWDPTTGTITVQHVPGTTGNTDSAIISYDNNANLVVTNSAGTSILNTTVPIADIKAISVSGPPAGVSSNGATFNLATGNSLSRAPDRPTCR